MLVFVDLLGVKKSVFGIGKLDFFLGLMSKIITENIHVRQLTEILNHLKTNLFVLYVEYELDGFIKNTRSKW